MSKPSGSQEISGEANVSIFTETLLLPTVTVSPNSPLIWPYRVRYLFIRWFTCPSSTLVSWIPIVGGKSILELLTLSFFYAILIAVCKGSQESGDLASAIAGLAVLIGLRNNFLTALFSISFERALFYHKLVAILSLVLSAMHGAFALFSSPDDDRNSSGFILIALMFIASLSYIVKQYFFELFYYFHFCVYFVIVILAAIHGATLLAVAVIFWVADLMIRYLLTSHREQAIIEVLPADVIRIRFPKSFAYSPGQYCFVSVPALSCLQFHPFTISSAPHELETKFHIRALGNWTHRLAQLVDTNGVPTAEAYPNTQSSGHVQKSWKVDVVVEGPFGIPSIDLMSAEYQVYLFITGGIGVTPAQSIFNHLVNAQREGHRNIRKCIFVWSVKDRAMAESMDQDRHEAPPLPMSFQPDLVGGNWAAGGGGGGGRDAQFNKNSVKPLPGPIVDIESVPLESAKDASDDRASIRGRPVPMQRQVSFSFDSNLATPDPFHAEFYLTSLRNQEEFRKAGIDSQKQPYLRFGRPDVPDLFTRVEGMCSAEGIGRVAVVCCGPSSLMESVQAECRKRGGCCGGVSFDLHLEEFNF